MPVEGSLVRPESSTAPCEKEQGSNSGTGCIPEWSLNIQTYKFLKEGRCTYNAEEQSLVWPPMLLMCSDVDSPDEPGEDFIGAKNLLAIEGFQANTVAETEHVCSEGNATYHLLVLPPTSESFAAAKAVDTKHGLAFSVSYPSLKDMLDIKNGRVPEFSRRHVQGLKYHGRRRQAWINLGVDLVRDDGICVGRGVCETFEPTDCVNEELLSELHVGVRVLEVLDALNPSHWKGCLRRWRTTHVLYNGVSLFECSRQHMEGKSESPFYWNGPDVPAIAQAQGVLRDQSISSVAPLISKCQDFSFNFNFDHLSATNSKTCRDAIDDIEKNTFKSAIEGQSLYDGKSFAMKYESDESLRENEIEIILNDCSKERNLMEVLGTTNSSHLARDVVKHLTVLQKLTDFGRSSTLISSMIKGAEDCQLSILRAAGEKVKRDKPNRIAMDGFGSEIEKFILQSRKVQHKRLLKVLAGRHKYQSRHLSTLDAFVLDKFQFVDDIVSRRKESEGVDQWLFHHIAETTVEEKKKWSKKVAEARKEEQKKWEEVVAKVHLEEQKKWEEELAKARMEEKKKWEEESAKVMTELAVARQELAEQKEVMPKCAICLEGLEGTMDKCGQKRSREVVQRKRACFTPCMHTSMCLDCAVEAWEKFRRCPVCRTPCPSKPQPIFI